MSTENLLNLNSLFGNQVIGEEYQDISLVYREFNNSSKPWKINTTYICNNASSFEPSWNDISANNNDLLIESKSTNIRMQVNNEISGNKIELLTKQLDIRVNEMSYNTPPNDLYTNDINIYGNLRVYGNTYPGTLIKQNQAEEYERNILNFGSNNDTLFNNFGIQILNSTNNASILYNKNTKLWTSNLGFTISGNSIINSIDTSFINISDGSCNIYQLFAQDISSNYIYSDFIYTNFLNANNIDNSYNYLNDKLNDLSNEIIILKNKLNMILNNLDIS